MALTEEKERIAIGKKDLEDLLSSWRDGSISEHEIHEWAELNYFPLTQKIGHGCPVYTSYAMGIILSQLDFAEPKTDSAEFAIEFLNTSLDDFGIRFRKFVDNCCGPIDEDEFDKAMERIRRFKSAK